MKLALCIYGQPRFHTASGYRSIKRFILEEYAPDVFFHTWWDASDIGKRYDAAPWSGVRGSEQLTVRPNVLEELLDLYCPIGYEAEPSRIFASMRDYSSNASHPDYSAPNLFSQTYSQERVAAIRESHGAVYDFVIRCRFDSLFFDFPDVASLAPERIHVPDVCPNPSLLYDCVSIASPADDSRLARRHALLDPYFDRGVTMNGEQMFTAHLIATGLIHRTVKVPWRVNHCRSWD